MKFIKVAFFRICLSLNSYFRKMKEIILVFNSSQKYTFFFFLNLFMAVLGLRFCSRAFSTCGKRGPLFIAVCGPLTIAASLVAEHRLQTRRLSNCGSQAQLLRGMWESSWARARTRVPFIGRQILNNCATREAQKYTFLLVTNLLSIPFQKSTY